MIEVLNNIPFSFWTGWVGFVFGYCACMRLEKRS